MADTYAPYFPMDSEHRGASTVITSYTLIVYTICAGVVRFCIQRKSETKFSFDDAGAVSAAVSSCLPDLRSHGSKNSQAHEWKTRSFRSQLMCFTQKLFHQALAFIKLLNLQKMSLKHFR